MLPLLRACRSNPFALALLLALGAALASRAQIVLACDICALHSSNVLDPPRHGWSVHVAEQYTSFNSYKNVDGQSLPVNEWLQSSTTNLVVGYGLGIPVRLEATIPFINREYYRSKDGHADRGDSSGLGDVALVARYTAIDQVMSDQSLIRVEVLAGFELPTGSTDELDDEDGQDAQGHLEAREGAEGPAPRPRHGGDGESTGIHDEDLALGSGSLDFLVGANVFTTYHRLFAAMGFQYSVRGNGDHGYDFANELSYHLGVGAYVMTHDPANVAIEARFTGETKGNDTQRHQTVAGTKTTALYFGPHFHATYADRLRGAVGIQVPVLQDVSGLQLVADYRILANLAWNF